MGRKVSECMYACVCVWVKFTHTTHIPSLTFRPIDLRPSCPLPPTIAYDMIHRWNFKRPDRPLCPCPMFHTCPTQTELAWPWTESRCTLDGNYIRPHSKNKKLDAELPYITTDGQRLCFIYDNSASHFLQQEHNCNFATVFLFATPAHI